MARVFAVEKIVAVARIYHALIVEVGEPLYLTEPIVQSALLDAAVKIALSTDTKDLGTSILGTDNPLRLDNLDGTTGTTVTDLAKGDHYAGMPGDADH